MQMTDTHLKFKQARQRAGLTVNQCADLLSIQSVTIRRYEMDPATTNTFRNAPPLTVKVLGWYADKVAPSLDAA